MRFYLDVNEVYNLSEKLSRQQVGLWAQLVAAMTSLGDGGLVSVSILRDQPVFLHRDIYSIIDSFCRQTTLLQPLDKNKKPLTDPYENETVCYLIMKSLEPKKKVFLNDRQIFMRAELLKVYPTMGRNLDEAIIRWTDLYPWLDLVKLAKEASLWAFNKKKKHKNHIAFLGNWFKNQSKYNGRSVEPTNLKGVHKI